MKLSENIKRIRKENNLSQEQFAEKIGVSRQAVSKWESGQSYPEMDKVLLICKLYNYNIDELMNENVKEVSETKESKININKYIDDFFAFITKTVDMIGAMTFKQKVKLFIEECVIALSLFIIFIIIGAFGSSILYGIFGRILPLNVYYSIRGIFESIFIVLGLVVSVTIMCHIFKIRYLDYYEMAKKEIENKNDENSGENNENDEVSNSKDKESKKDNKLELKENSNKIIIRDPEHSQSKFITGIVKFIVLCIKGFAIFMGINFSFSFIGLVTLFVLSFLFIKTGLLFVGGIIGVLSGILINFVILELLYNFVMDRKNHKTRVGIMLISALIMAGISCGLVTIGITSFNINKEAVNTEEKEYSIEMQEDLIIRYYGISVEYVPEDRADIKIVVKHSPIINVQMEKDNNIVRVINRGTEDNFMDSLRNVIEDINNKQITNYDDVKMYIYASEGNIQKIMDNLQRYDDNQMQSELDSLREENNELEMQIKDLEAEVAEKDVIIESKEEELKEKESIIENLSK